MSKAKYQEYEAILIQARRRIETGSHSFICWAVGGSTGNNQRKQELTEWITGMLEKAGQCTTYETFLKKNHGKVPPPEEVRAGRLAWLDWMIAEMRRP